MNELARFISEIIAETGPISLETYMNFAMLHPRHGYYATKAPLGATGDFTTAPEISQIFGELVGLWAAAVWRSMGAPKPFILAELGPGRGSLMADALRATRTVPDFHDAADLRLVEASGPLRQSQRAALAAFPLRPVWHRMVGELPSGPAIIIANEFFDCLPIRHFVRGKDGWHEKLVGLDDSGNFRFGLAPDPEPSLTGTNGLGQRRGEILEVGFAASQLMSGIAARLTTQGGALIVVDYGYDAPPLSETLQAIKQHRFTDPLRDPGEADLTAHVNFSSLAEAAHAAGAKVYGPVPQGEWLARLGVHARAAALKQRANDRQRAEIESAVFRLAGGCAVEAPATSMARLFKALAVTAPGLAPPPGF